MANSHGVTASRADYMARVEILVTIRCIRIVLGDLKNYIEQCQTSGKQKAPPQQLSAMGDQASSKCVAAAMRYL